jgi:hypothetical protein
MSAISTPAVAVLRLTFDRIITAGFFFTVPLKVGLPGRIRFKDCNLFRFTLVSSKITHSKNATFQYPKNDHGHSKAFPLKLKFQNVQGQQRKETIESRK